MRVCNSTSDTGGQALDYDQTETVFSEHYPNVIGSGRYSKPTYSGKIERYDRRADFRVEEFTSNTGS